MVLCLAELKRKVTQQKYPPEKRRTSPYPADKILPENDQLVHLHHENKELFGNIYQIQNTLITV